VLAPLLATGGIESKSTPVPPISIGFGLVHSEAAVLPVWVAGVLVGWPPGVRAGTLVVGVGEGWDSKGNQWPAAAAVT
jgi:hypothetical protein